MKPEKFGNYTLIRLLGKGGMAEVFLARATSIGGFEKLVAIKRLLPPFNIDSQILSMLADEARLSVWLTHPNIVQVLDFGRVGKTYYIAMEYVPGCDLCDLIRPDGQSPGKPLPLPTVLYIMVQVAEALDFAHRRRNDKGEPLRVIHRDVSPHNVLISAEGQIKLADFGLARASISVHHSHAGVIRGKFSYMPKEQAHGREIDHRIDLFAAGVTLYEGLTGVKPYTSTTLAQQLYQLEQPVPPPSALIPDIPEEIDDLTMQAMSPDTGDRYQTAEDLAGDLRAALLKVSTFAQEERQLTALVKNALARRGGPPILDPLPQMSLADIPLTDDNLIGDELRLVRLTQYPVQESRQVPAPDTDESPLLHRKIGASRRDARTGFPDLSGEDEEGDTAQFQGSKRAVLKPQQPEFDPQRTVAYSPDETAAPAPSLPPAALSVAADHEAVVVVSEDRIRPPDTAAIDRSAGEVLPYTPSAPGTARTPSGPYPAAGAEPYERRSSPSYPPAAGAVEEDGMPVATDAFEVAPYDTLRDPEQAGRLAREAIDEARTVQRSPEEALAAFRRALEEREAPPPPRAALGWVHWVGLGAAGVILLCVGVAVGWVIHKPAPSTPITIRQECPKPKPCTCPEPKPCPAPAAPATATDGRSAADAAPATQPAADPAPDRPPQPKAAARPRAARPKATPRRRPGRRPAAAAPPRGMGFIVIRSDSPAKAYIDDRQFAAPVPSRLPLSPGIHRVRVLYLEINKVSETRWVTIQAGKSTSVKFTLQE